METTDGPQISNHSKIPTHKFGDEISVSDNARIPITDFANTMVTGFNGLQTPPRFRILTWMEPITVNQPKHNFKGEDASSPNSKKRGGGGRPLKPDSELKRPRPNPRSKPTKLISLFPVKVDIPTDVWGHIFRFTQYKTVLNLRLTCKEFLETIRREGFWKRYLEQNVPVPGFEQQFPNLPPNLSHMLYADLLFGHGCMACGAVKTQKVQWSFFSRWCKECFWEQTISAQEAQSVTQQTGLQLLDCLPAAEIDLWRNYSKATLSSTETPTIAYRRVRELKYVAIRKKDLTQIINEYDEYLARLPSDLDEIQREEQLKIWLAQKTALAQTKLAAAKECQEFGRARAQCLEQIDAEFAEKFRLERQSFFERKAKTLDPPLDLRALEMVPGYKESLETRRSPTERSWREMLLKIERYRSHLEEEAKLELPSIGGDPYSPSESSQKAQKLLLDIADTVMKELDESSVAPEDFIYLALREIREQYYALPLDQVPSSDSQDCVRLKDGSAYVLCLDDARFVYHEKIENHVNEWTDADNRRKGSFVYCPGCIRREYKKKYTFDALFEHIRFQHGDKISGPFRSYKQADIVTNGISRGLKWRALPWPRNLPMLAPHHKATGLWDPDETNYECAPPKAVCNYSAFEGRIVRPRKLKSGSAIQHVIDGILEAAAKLKDSPMPRPFRARIAWDYGMRTLAQINNASKLTSSDVDQISAGLIRAGEFKIFSAVGCESCVDPKLLKPHKYVEMKHSFELILNHWKQEHYKARVPPSVETGMLHLPNGFELAFELAKEGPGRDQTRAAFDYLFPIDTSNQTKPSLAVGTGRDGRKKKADEKGNEVVNRNSNDDEPIPNTTRRGKRLPVDALNVLAEQAAKIDPRLRS